MTLPSKKLPSHSDLIVFVEALRYITKQYTYGENRDDYNYRGKLVMIAISPLWHDPAKSEAQFDTWFGEFLALMLDTSPMIEWINEYKTEKIPNCLNVIEKLLLQNNNPIANETLADIEAATVTLLKAVKSMRANRQKTETMELYKIISPFYTRYFAILSKDTQERWIKVAKLLDSILERT